ncbi:HAD family hydrolase [Micromonospora sp. NBC_01796]|uniref:HAD family hydrolase n=1 Tax=Micromonospora sp. NBC_01796 TaxID=2975987 RepID=UPI002DD88AD0|nr:haloacid dehalogenase-like hydrolase [Micromonospora sp. NBC_01796]WSA82953.1 haloacid dehalogenase-like hydrolase [Micromonospora sp. NBC_01796]
MTAPASVPPDPVAAAPRLLMWDIDGTLVHTGAAAKLAYAEAFTALTGVAWQRMPHSAGRTDRDLAAEAFVTHGVADYEPYLEEFFHRYAAALAARRHLIAEQGRVLPGVGAVLAGLAGHPHVIQTLVTGNIPSAAVHKLAALGLGAGLDLDIGGYGRHNTVRADLVRQCRDLAEAKYGHRFAPADILVIGDTVHDVAGALANGVTAVGVATGTTSAADLAEAGAQIVLTDLGAVEPVVRILAGTDREAAPSIA